MQHLVKALTFGKEWNQEYTQEQQIKTMKQTVENLQKLWAGLWTLTVKLGVSAKFTLISQGQKDFIWDIFARIWRSFYLSYVAMKP